MNGVKDIYSRIRSTIKLLKSEYFAIRIHITGSIGDGRYYNNNNRVLLPTFRRGWIGMRSSSLYNNDNNINNDNDNDNDNDNETNIRLMIKRV